MKKLALTFACSFLLSIPAFAEETINNKTDVSSQDYDKQFEENMKEATAQLKSMTNELVNYMNTLNKALDDSMPQMTDSMSKVISSMKPVAATMQKNMDNFINELNQQLELPEGSNIQTTNETLLPPENVMIPEAELTDRNHEIDKELLELAPPAPDLPQKKIKLFPSTVE